MEQRSKTNPKNIIKDKAVIKQSSKQNFRMVIQGGMHWCYSLLVVWYQGSSWNVDSHYQWKIVMFVSMEMDKTWTKSYSLTFICFPISVHGIEWLLHFSGFANINSVMVVPHSLRKSCLFHVLPGQLRVLLPPPPRRKNYSVLWDTFEFCLMPLHCLENVPSDQGINPHITGIP